MARRPNEMEKALEKAMADVSHDIMLRAIGNTPTDMSLGDLVDAMDRTSFAAEFRALDLAAFCAALGQTPVRRGPGRPAGKKSSAGTGAPGLSGGGPRMSFSTRTQAGREALDAAISEALAAAPGPQRSEALKSKLGGTPNQIRQSLARLMEAGKVVKKGEKRATEYHWKGRG